MEVELAAVEEDVERKRVGKNPFDEKFTALVRIPGPTHNTAEELHPKRVLAPFASHLDCTLHSSPTFPFLSHSSGDSMAVLLSTLRVRGDTESSFQRVTHSHHCKLTRADILKNAERTLPTFLLHGLSSNPPPGPFSFSSMF